VTVGKGLLAQWRRGIFARGLAGAAMLAVPVAVAAMIGFGTSLSGVSEGLGALASGPPATQPTADRDRGRAPIDGAISAVATSTGGGGERSAAAPAPAPPRGGGDDGGSGTGGGPEAPGATPTVPDTGTGTGTGGGGTQEPTEQPVPQIDVTPTTPGGGGLQGLLDDVGNAVNQLLGGGG
jgi:hypothetical protein